MDSEHVCVGIVATVGELIGIDQYQLFDTRKDWVLSFNILLQKNHGGLFFSAEKRLKINQHIPEVHQSSVISDSILHGHIWAQPSMSNLGRIDLVNPKTRHELMDE